MRRSDQIEQLRVRIQRQDRLAREAATPELGLLHAHLALRAAADAAAIRIAYHRRREADERRRALAARDPGVRQRHFALALCHAARIVAERAWTEPSYAD